MTVIKVILIPWDEEEPIEVRQIAQGDIKAMQAFVDGYFEVIDLDRLEASMWVNENGLNTGLPLNDRATRFLYRVAPEYIGFSAIVGNAFLAGMPNSEGDTQTVPDAVIDMFGA